MVWFESCPKYHETRYTCVIANLIAVRHFHCFRRSKSAKYVPRTHVYPYVVTISFGGELNTRIGLVFEAYEAKGKDGEP